MSSIKRFSSHYFLTNSLVFLVYLGIRLSHDLAVKSAQESGFLVSLILSFLNVLYFRKQQMVTLFDVHELFWVNENITISCQLLLLFRIYKHFIEILHMFLIWLNKKCRYFLANSLLGDWTAFNKVPHILVS